MSKIVIIFSLILSLLFPVAAFAQDEPASTPSPRPDTNLNLGEKQILDALPNSNLDNLTFGQLVGSTLAVINTLVGFLALLGLIVSGIMYITAGGDTDKASKAQKNILYIVIGIVVYVLALLILPAVRGAVCYPLQLGGALNSCEVGQQ